MPELPEVETTRRGIAAPLTDKTVTQVIARHTHLRWPIPAKLAQTLSGHRLRSIDRRAKYLLLRFDHGTLIMHLGMSGSLRVIPADTTADKHDHLDIVFDKTCLRLHDPRRFGAVLWTEQPAEQHALLEHLGPEPLSSEFDANHLYQQSRSRRVAIKNFIMDGRIVVGVGNIYANESLFRAGIHPARPCNRISFARYAVLVSAIKDILAAAIKKGGTTLQDFQQADGRPGYFVQQLQVYGKGGQECPHCGTLLKEKRIGQRSSFYCSHCQH